MDFLPRTLEQTLRKASQSYKVVMLSGLRQVGKSTLLKHMADDSRSYVTLDDPTVMEAAVSSPSLFFRGYRAPAILDEIQTAPQLLRTLKMTVDASDLKGQYWITGSQKLALMSSASDLLPGRLVSFDLLPLSVYEREGLGALQKPYLPSLELLDGNRPLPNRSPEETWRMIWQGAWPDVIHKEAADRRWFFRSMLDFYIAKDVMALNSVQDRSQFLKFMTSLALFSGKLLNYSALSEVSGVSQPTVKRWLSIAEATGLIYLVRPYYANIKKQLVKSPKLLMADTGLMAYLLGIDSPEEMSKHINSGAFFETFCLIEIIKSWLHNGESPEFFFYRENRGAEIDLLIKHQSTYWPVEIKKSGVPDTHDTKWIRRFEDNFSETGASVGTGAVIGFNEKPYPLSDSIVAHNIWSL